MSSSPSSSNKSPSFNPAPREDWELISQGAEARVWKVPINDNNDPSRPFVVCKERFSKAYRHPDLDQRLTKSRCRSEARILEKCAKFGIRVPQVIRVEAPLLYTEFIGAPTVKARLVLANEKHNKIMETIHTSLAQAIGSLIGRLHNSGIVHGDLTTSNILWGATSDHDDDDDLLTMELVLIDFGLSKSTNSVEEQAVDLYVLERALQSTHPELQKQFFEQLLQVYGKIREEHIEHNNHKRKQTQSALSRLEQVRQRGRKRECFG